MSAPAFTPGPWRIAKRGEDEAFYVVERDEPNEPSRHAYRVAHVLDYNELQQNAANARLIAAAPDLFAALYSLLDFEEPDSILDQQTDVRLREERAAAVGAAHAALAKAQGAQS